MCPANEGCDWSWGREQGSGPKGFNDPFFPTYGEFYPCPSWFSSKIKAFKLRFKSSRCDLGFEARIWPQGWDLGFKAIIWASRLGFEPEGWDLGLKARIWASRLVFELWGWYLGLEFETGGGEWGEGENSPYVWKHKSLTPSELLPQKNNNNNNNISNNNITTTT